VQRRGHGISTFAKSRRRAHAESLPHPRRSHAAPATTQHLIHYRAESLQARLEAAAARVTSLLQELHTSGERHATETFRLKRRLQEAEFAASEARRQAAALKLSSKGLTIDQVHSLVSGEEVCGLRVRSGGPVALGHLTPSGARTSRSTAAYVHTPEACTGLCRDLSVPCHLCHLALPGTRAPHSLSKSVVATVLVARNGELAAAERRLEAVRADAEAARSEATKALDAAERRRQADVAKEAAEREKLRRRELQLEVRTWGCQVRAWPGCSVWCCVGCRVGVKLGLGGWPQLYLICCIPSPLCPLPTPPLPATPARCSTSGTAQPGAPRSWRLSSQI
jgi:hypothetical protein